MKKHPLAAHRFRLRTVAVAVAVAGVLAVQGCAVVDGRGEDPNTLRMMIPSNPSYPKQYAAWQRHIASEFHRRTGANVAFDTFAGGTDELTDIQTSVVSGQGPDVYSIGTTFTPTAYATGAFVKLTAADWKAVGGKSRFTTASLGISGPNSSSQVGVPLRSRPFVMAVNTKILAAHGITEMPTTWDQLVADAKTVTGGGVYGMAVDYADGLSPWKYIWGLSVIAGNSIVSGSKATIDSVTVRAAYRSYFSWIVNDKVVDPAAVGWNNAQALAAFADGKAAFFPMTTATAMNTLSTSSVAHDYEFAVMPTVPPGATTRPAGGVDAASILSGDNLVVANYTTKAKQRLAWKLINLLTSPSEELYYYKRFGDLPTDRSAADALSRQNSKLAPIVRAGELSKATAFSGAWADTQLELVDVVTQLIPALKRGDVSDAALARRVRAAQHAAQSSLERQKNGGL